MRFFFLFSMHSKYKSTQKTKEKCGTINFIFRSLIFHPKKQKQIHIHYDDNITTTKSIKFLFLGENFIY